mgnify:CR=1 FL=1
MTTIIYILLLGAIAIILQTIIYTVGVAKK